MTATWSCINRYSVVIATSVLLSPVIPLDCNKIVHFMDKPFLRGYNLIVYHLFLLWCKTYYWQFVLYLVAN